MDFDIKEFYKKNKSYCDRPFKEIYVDSAGQYKLCCHAFPLFKNPYSIHTTLPFDYFFSSEMEEIRNKMLSGEKIKECNRCYQQEESSNYSYRNSNIKYKDKIHFKPNKIMLKLRIHGSYCNLGCYMCNAWNSSTRRNELKNVYSKEIKDKNHYAFSLWGKNFKNITTKNWNEIVDNILENIHFIGSIHLTGGEPLQLPKHWEFLNKIPKEHAKNIELNYDTNLTELKYKNKSIFDIKDKFKDVKLGVSCDHYKEKLSWMRYPIDVNKFESNLKEANSLIKQINCTVSLLNIFDLEEIYEYYSNNFDIHTSFQNIVRVPQILSIKNLNNNNKKIILKKYPNMKNKMDIIINKNNDYSELGTHFLDYITSEINKSPIDDKHKNFIKYCDDLSLHRNFDWKDLWTAQNF